MKRLLFLLSLAIIIAFSGCQKETFTCKIVSPYNGQSVLFNKDLLVKVEIKDTKSVVTNFVIFLNDTEFPRLESSIIPYDFTIPFHHLTLGKLTIKVVATNDNGIQAESSVTVNIVESLGVKEESPDFVTFSNGKMPLGWSTYSWEIEDKIGYSDNYSLRSVNYPVALVFANKTIKTNSYIEFYTKGGDVHLLIDGVKAEPFSSEPAEREWTKWIYPVDTGKHQFQWQAEGVFKYLDDIRFVANLP